MMNKKRESSIINMKINERENKTEYTLSISEIDKMIETVESILNGSSTLITDIVNVRDNLYFIKGWMQNFNK